MNKVIRDYVRGIPSAVKFDWNNFRTRPSLYNKKLQKEAYRGKLPDYIIDHKKTGWRFPTDEILIGHINAPAPNNGILKDYIREILKDKELQDLFEYTTEEIETKYLNNKIHAVPGSGRKAEIGLNSQKELFLTLNFAVWRKVFNVSI